MFEREYRLMSHVPRWSIVRQIKGQNVAEHSYFVALYVSQICDVLEFDMETKWLSIEAALYHDLDETFTGDIPGPSKRSMVDPDKTLAFTNKMLVERFNGYGFRQVERKKITGIPLIIKLADLVDEVMYLSTEFQMGNASVEAPLSSSRTRMYQALDALADGYPQCKDKCGVLREILAQAEYEHTNGQDKMPYNSSDIGKV